VYQTLVNVIDSTLPKGYRNRQGPYVLWVDQIEGDKAQKDGSSSILD